jgi:hypothetical protein
MSNRKALAVLAGIILALGVILALVPTSVSSGEVSCGSALAPDSGTTSDASLAEFKDAIGDAYRGGDGTDNGGYVALCEDRVSTQRFIAFPIAGVGALVLAFLLLTASSQVQAQEPPGDVARAQGHDGNVVA